MTGWTDTTALAAWAPHPRNPQLTAAPEPGTPEHSIAIADQALAHGRNWDYELQADITRHIRTLTTRRPEAA